MAKQKATTRPRSRKAAAKAQSGSGARTILLLQTITEMNGDFALSELAKRAGLPASSVHRILQPLVRSRLVARSQGSAYRIGYEYYRLAAKVLHQVEHEVNAAPFLHPLWRKWQETAVFCLFRPAQRYGIITEIIQSPHPLRHVIEPFASISLPWGSLGRAILAQLKPAEIAAIRAKAAKGPVTGSVGPELKALLPELAKVRENGYALYRNPTADLAGVAAPVFRSDNNVIGSLGITMPVSRFDRLNTRDLCLDVVKAAAALGRSLGHTRTKGEVAARLNRF